MKWVFGSLRHPAGPEHEPEAEIGSTYEIGKKSTNTTPPVAGS